MEIFQAAQNVKFPKMQATLSGRLYFNGNFEVGKFGGLDDTDYFCPCVAVATCNMMWHNVEAFRYYLGLKSGKFHYAG